MSSMAGGNHRTDNIFGEIVKVDNYKTIINVSAFTEHRFAQLGQTPGPYFRAMSTEHIQHTDSVNVNKLQTHHCVLCEQVHCSN